MNEVETFEFVPNRERKKSRFLSWLLFGIVFIPVLICTIVVCVFASIGVLLLLPSYFTLPENDIICGPPNGPVGKIFLKKS
jgi:hypothetical protein